MTKEIGRRIKNLFETEQSKNRRIMDENVNNKTRRQTFGEEIGNTISHGVSAFIVLALMPIIYILLYKNILNNNGNTRDVVGVAIFLVSIFMMFLMSTIYHAMGSDSLHKLVMRKLDHIFIYVAIAGSYTPIAISLLWDIPGYGKALSIIVIALQWAMVIFGVIFKSVANSKKMTTSLPIYLIMGWTLVFIFPLFIKYARPELFLLILAGGLFYTLGVVFIALDRKKFFHMVWHFFVSLGAFSHLIGISFFLR